MGNNSTTRILILDADICMEGHYTILAHILPATVQGFSSKQFGDDEKICSVVHYDHLTSLQRIKGSPQV